MHFIIIFDSINEFAVQSCYCYLNAMSHLNAAFYTFLLQPFIKLKVMRHTTARCHCIRQQTCRRWIKASEASQIHSPINSDAAACGAGSTATSFFLRAGFTSSLLHVFPSTELLLHLELCVMCS